MTDLSHRNQQPGKLNLKNFAIVNEAIARMTVTDGQQQSQQSSQQQQQQLEGDHSRRRRPPPQPAPRHLHTMAGGVAAAAAAASVGRRSVAQTRSKSNGSLFFAPHYAPLAAADPDGDSDDDDDLAEYAQVKEVYAPSADGLSGCSAGGPPPDASGGGGLMMYAFPHDGQMGATTPSKHHQQQPAQPPGKLARHRRDVNKSEWFLIGILSSERFLGISPHLSINQSTPIRTASPARPSDRTRTATTR